MGADRLPGPQSRGASQQRPSLGSNPPGSSSGLLEQCLSKFNNGAVVHAVLGVGLLVGVFFLLMEVSAEEQFEGSSWEHFWVPLIMSFFAGLSTTLGGLVIFLMGKSPSDTAMALVLGLAAGVMIAVCIFDFWLPAILVAWTDGDPWEMILRAVWTGVGVLLFLALSRYLDAHGHSQENIATETALAVGGDGGDVEKGIHSAKPDGVFGTDTESADEDESIDEAVVEIKHGQNDSGDKEENANVAMTDTPANRAHRASAVAAQKWRLALLMMITLTAHNFPEGAAVAFSALESRRLGFVVMSAIAVHNIPEGLAIAVPVLASTGDRWKAIWMTLASGMSEPLGAAVGLLVLRPVMTEEVLQNMLCAVAGIMAAVSLGELLPEAVSYKQNGAVLAGFAVGLLSIFLTYELV